MRKFKRFNHVKVLIPLEAWAIPNIVAYLLVDGIGYSGLFSLTLMSVELFQYISLNPALIAGLKGSTSAIGLCIGSLPASLAFGKLPPKYVIPVFSVFSLASAISLSRLDYSTDSW
ncbi:unnamed protein product [Kuraishia capsulata CBS 1993]|uniref:Uncharacterized protein n=1 Tax=Kuraishia capsulata CBS 1993 TaxID=1382522 RepID=W6MHQ3_9ASCO|nr:uncharacterized protein KUCA_T00001814001 [Kuraishia capsulata CBS 1993]CDK25844.1 unnamed protein product [Kuraishia capsulata CBS 1993]